MKQHFLRHTERLFWSLKVVALAVECRATTLIEKGSGSTRVKLFSDNVSIFFVLRVIFLPVGLNVRVGPQGPR